MDKLNLKVVRTLTVPLSVQRTLMKLYDMFAEACFAIACNKKNFEWGLTKIDIVYKED